MSKNERKAVRGVSMELDKAIEIVTTFTFASKTIPRNDVNDAIKLLIEAGKRVKDNPMVARYYLRALLPGEMR